jgi:hypothetical protein
MSFGFTPLIFNHTRSIIYGGTDEQTKNFITEYSTVHASGLKHLKGRAELNILNSNTEQPKVIVKEILNFRKKFKFVAVTLCRSTKISKDYLNTIYSLLIAEPDLCFIAAGLGVRSLQFDQSFIGRLLLLDEILPESLLAFADIYIETFPETQGRAVVEAIEYNIPVIFLKNDNFTHTNLQDRSNFGLCKSDLEIVSLSISVLHDPKLRQDFLADQLKISGQFLCKPDNVWKTIIEAFNYYDMV